MTEKKPPLILPLLVVLQLFTSGLLGALMFYQSLSAGTSGSGYLFTSGLVMLFVTIVLGLPGLFFIRRSINLTGGGGIVLLLQAFYGYCGYSGPATALVLLGSDGVALNSSFFTMGLLSMAITATIVFLRLLKEDLDYTSKLWNFGPTILLTFLLRFPALYSTYGAFFTRYNYGVTWPFSASLAFQGFPIMAGVFIAHWITQIPWFIAFHIVVYVIRTYQDRILNLLDSGIATNFYNVLPTLVILFLVMGASLLESFQFGATRHQLSANMQEFVPEVSDWNIFNTPDWTFDLGNLLDQLTAGLKAPDEPLFYITTVKQYDANGEVPVTNPKEPLAYWWRKEVYTTYGYRENPSITANGRSNWDKVPLDYRSFGGTSYGAEPASKNATYQIEYLAAKDENDDTWQGFIPATWNGPYGSYITGLTDPAGSLVQEATLDGASISYKDSLGVWTQASVDTGSTQSVLTYNTDFRFDPSDVILASLGSGFRDEDSYLAAIEDGFEVSSTTAQTIWNTIKQAYLQKPGSTAGTLPPGVSSYAQWAPNTTGLAADLNNDELSVYRQAVQTMNYIAPDPASVQEGLQTFASGGTEEPLVESENSFTYDWQAWLLAQYGQDPAPEEGEDYVEWFIDRQKGVAAHFASALAVLLRLQGIPARFVSGYLVGNTTMDPDRVVMTARWQHAWAEVLIPISDVLGNKHVEWVVFDPLFSALYPEYGGGKVTAIVNPNTISKNQNIFNVTMPISLGRIGLADETGNSYIDTTDLDTNYPEIRAADPTYLSTAKAPIIINSNLTNPTIVNVSVAVADVKRMVYDDPVFGSFTIYSDPVFIPDVNVRFFLYKQIGTVGNTTDYKVPIFSNGTLYVNTKTNKNGIASFNFPYNLTQGWGEFRFEANITLKDSKGNDVNVDAVTDVNPFNDQNAPPISFETFTLTYVSSLLSLPFNEVNSIDESDGTGEGDALLKTFVDRLASNFKVQFDRTMEGIIEHTSNIIESAGKNPGDGLFSMPLTSGARNIVEPVVSKSVFEILALKTSEENNFRAIFFLRRLSALD